MLLAANEVDNILLPSMTWHRVRIAVVEKTTCRTQRAKRREIYPDPGGLCWCAIAHMACHIGRGKARIGRVHLYAFGDEILGELQRQHIEGCFGGTVSGVADGPVLARDVGRPEN